MYAYYKKLDYFSTECIYSPNAYRGFAREFLKDLEKIRPSAIIDIIHAGEQFQIKETFKKPIQTTCTKCGYISSNKICKACLLLEGLNKGKAKIAIGRESSGLTAQMLAAEGNGARNDQPAATTVDRRNIATDSKLEF